MALLSTLTLENFRSFRRRTTFELAPLTILTGPNSSGKSSVLKALLFLQHNARLDRLVTPTFAGGEHRLGSLQSVRSHESDESHTGRGAALAAVRGTHSSGEPAESRIGFGVAFDWGEFDEFEYERDDGVRDEFNGPIGHVRFRLDYAPNPNHFLDGIATGTYSEHGLEEAHNFARLWDYGIATGKLGNERPLFALRIKQSLDDVQLDAPVPVGSTDEGEEILSNTVRTIRRQYEIELHGGWFFSTSQEAAEALGLPTSRAAENAAHFLSSTLRIEVGDTHTVDAPPRKLEDLVVAVTDPSSWTKVRCEGESVTEAIMNNRFFARAMSSLVRPYLMRWTAYLTQKLGEVDHVGALRASPQRLFLDDGADRFTDLLHRAQFNYRLNDEPELERARSETDRLLGEFGIGEGLSVQRVGDAAYTVEVQRGERQVHLADLGYGYTQLVPLILHAAYSHDSRAQPFPTLLVEEPEANLHPNLQAKLADLFITMSRPEGSHTVVETHSEYLIRRLQYLVAKGEVEPERVVLYYLGPDPEAEDYVRRIYIDEHGQLSQEFGPGFLDEATNLMVNLFKYGSAN